MKHIQLWPRKQRPYLPVICQAYINAWDQNCCTWKNYFNNHSSHKLFGTTFRMSTTETSTDPIILLFSRK